MICLKNRTFAVSQTTTFEPLRHVLGCDLLEKSYFCSIANNRICLKCNNHGVVICLKNRTFAVSQTTLAAFVLLFLRCDLLEKSYFCSIANNTRKVIQINSNVVICLKNRTFAVSQTTLNDNVRSIREL